MVTIALLTTVVSCSKKDSCVHDLPFQGGSGMPVVSLAGFNNTGAGIASSNISLTNTSTHAPGYSWDFRDKHGSTSSLPTYLKKGTYTVKLTATGIGDSVTTTSATTIEKPTSVKIMGSTVIEMPLIKSTGATWDTPASPYSGENLFK